MAGELKVAIPRAPRMTSSLAMRQISTRARSSKKSEVPRPGALERTRGGFDVWMSSLQRERFGKLNSCTKLHAGTLHTAHRKHGRQAFVLDIPTIVIQSVLA